MIQKWIWLIHSMQRHKKIILHRSVSVLFCMFCFFLSLFFSFLKYHNHNSVPLLIQACFCFDYIMLEKNLVNSTLFLASEKKHVIGGWLGVKMSIQFSSSHLIFWDKYFVCLFCFFEKKWDFFRGVVNGILHSG